MANRHKHMKKASGGRTAYTGGDSNVAHEAAQKKGGGGVHIGKVSGSKSKSRIKKARGGCAGSDNNPFSSAHRG